MASCGYSAGQRTDYGAIGKYDNPASYAINRKSRDPMTIAKQVMALVKSHDPVVVAQRTLADTKSGTTHIGSEVMAKSKGTPEKDKSKNNNPFKDMYGWRTNQQNPFTPDAEKYDPLKKTNTPDNWKFRYDYHKPYNRPRYNGKSGEVAINNGFYQGKTQPIAMQATASLRYVLPLLLYVNKGRMIGNDGGSLMDGLDLRVNSHFQKPSMN